MKLRITEEYGVFFPEYRQFFFWFRFDDPDDPYGYTYLSYKTLESARTFLGHFQANMATGIRPAPKKIIHPYP